MLCKTCQFCMQGNIYERRGRGRRKDRWLKNVRTPYINNHCYLLCSGFNSIEQVTDRQHTLGRSTQKLVKFVV